MGHATRKTLSLGGSVLFGLVMFAVAGLVVSLTILPPLLQYQTYVVLSGSMEPAIHTGSVIVAMAEDPAALKVGDVITFMRSGDNENVTHRIASISGSGQGRTFVTKGDANNVDDPGSIHYDHLAGKVVLSVPYAGYIFKFLGSPNMRFLMIVVPGILLLGTWLWEIWRPEARSTPPAEAEITGLTPAAAAAPNLSLAQTEVKPTLAAADAAAVPLRQ